jgi:hypothetical protein
MCLNKCFNFVTSETGPGVTPALLNRNFVISQNSCPIVEFSLCVFRELIKQADKCYVQKMKRDFSTGSQNNEYKKN